MTEVAALKKEVQDLRVALTTLQLPGAVCRLGNGLKQSNETG